tara:strand:- start:1253 stop:2446 length:1194 start_codon:yes stop_codon:yes gene_type:complete
MLDRFSIVKVRDQESKKLRPICIGPDGVFIPVSLYLRELQDWRGAASGSLEDVAYILCGWLNYTCSISVEWSAVKDTNYLHYLKSKNNMNGLGRNRSNRIASVVARWYVFLVSREIGGDALSHFVESITLPDSRGPHTATPAYRYRAKRGPKLKNGKKRVPRIEEVERVLDELADKRSPYLSERDLLLGMVAARTGLRAMGLAALSLTALTAMLSRENIVQSHQNIEHFTGDIHGQAEIRAALGHLVANGRNNLILKVTEKGENSRSVLFPIDLAISILDHVWQSRATMIRQGRGGVVDGLWITATRRPRELAIGSLKKIVAAAFAGANVQGSAHSLKAHYLTRLAAKLRQEAIAREGPSYDSRTVMLQLAEAAGHKTFATLAHYLDEAVLFDMVDD